MARREEQILEDTGTLKVLIKEVIGLSAGDTESDAEFGEMVE